MTIIKKALSTQKEIKNFKENYSNGELKTQVISNLIQPSYKDKSVGIDQYFKFWYQQDKTSEMLMTELMFMISHYGKKALKESFGKHDFTFEGNRKYELYVLDFDGLTIIAPSKREIVIPENITDIDLRNKVIQFENAYAQFVVDYFYKNNTKLEDYEKDNLDKMKRLGIISENNQINFSYSAEPKTTSQTKMKP